MSGDSSTLTWTTDGAVSASLDNGIGTVDLNGSIVVTPARTTVYTLASECMGWGASATAVVTVLSAPAATVEMTADPTTITLGNSTTLTWTSTNAVSVSIDNSIGNVSLNGSLSISPTETTVKRREVCDRSSVGLRPRKLLSHIILLPGLSVPVNVAGPF